MSRNSRNASLNGGKGGSEILADVILLQKPSRKASEPGKVIVPCSGRLTAIQPKPIEEFRDNGSLELIDVADRLRLTSIPFPEHVKEGSVAVVGLDTHNVGFGQFVQVAVITLTDLIEKRVLLRVVQRQIRIPTLLESVINVRHHIVGVAPAGGHTFDFRDSDPLSFQTAGLGVKAKEFDIPTLSFGDFRRNKAIRRAETGRHFLLGDFLGLPAKV